MGIFEELRAEERLRDVRGARDASLLHFREFGEGGFDERHRLACGKQMRVHRVVVGFDLVSVCHLICVVWN